MASNNNMGVLKIKDPNTGNFITIPIPKGDLGPIGKTPNLTIGTVTALPAGSTPTASFGGTPENPVLNLALPIGNTGTVVTAGNITTTTTVTQETNTVPTNKAVYDMMLNLLEEF